MDIVNAIQSRRSIRKYKDIPITEENVKILIEAARVAPTPGNNQNWMFGIVTDKKVIKALSEAAGSQHWIASAPLVIALCTELKMNLKALRNDDFVLQVNKERFGNDFIEYLKEYPDQKSVALLFENGNPLIAGEHIFLTAISLGLSACWIGYLDIKRASSILNLPSNYVCLYLMPIGYADEDPKELERKRVEDITFSNQFK